MCTECKKGQKSVKRPKTIRTVLHRLLKIIKIINSNNNNFPSSLAKFSPGEGNRVLIKCWPYRVCYNSKWRPYIQSLMNNLETVERKAARFVYNNYYRYSSVSEMLRQSTQFGKPAPRRLDARATMIYKIINNLVHVDQRCLSYNLRNTRRHSLHLYHLLILSLVNKNRYYGTDESPRMCNLFNNC